MRINRNDTVAGHPIKLARDMAKELVDGSSMNVTHVTRWILSKGAERLPTYDPRYKRPTKADTAKGQAFLDEMVARGWLVEHQDGDGHYECSEKGYSLALASLLKPIPRTKADKILADFVERARAINANPDLLYWVKELRAFGSYITKSPDLGDIDIAWDLQRRPIEGDWLEANKRRADASGKKIVWPHTLYYGLTEVQFLLKSRNPYLSFHNVNELKGLKAESRVIYEMSAV